MPHKAMPQEKAAAWMALLQQAKKNSREETEGEREREREEEEEEGGEVHVSPYLTAIPPSLNSLTTFATLGTPQPPELPPAYNGRRWGSFLFGRCRHPLLGLGGTSRVGDVRDEMVL